MLSFQETLILGFILVILVAVMANIGSRAHGRHGARRRAHRPGRETTRIRRHSGG